MLAAPAIPPTRGFHDECLKGERAVLAGLHEAEPRLAVRQRALVRVSWVRRLSRLCRSDGRHRIRVRDQPDGDATDRRPPRCGAQRRALLRSPGVRGAAGDSRKEGIMTTIKAFITRHPVPTYFALTFAISWGGFLLVIGGPGGFPGTSGQIDPLFPFVVLAMLAGPSVAGILLTGLVDGRAGLREFLSRLLKWRVGARWYAVALLPAPLLATAVLLALRCSRLSSSRAFSPRATRPLFCCSVSRWGWRASSRSSAGRGSPCRAEAALRCPDDRAHRRRPVGGVAFPRRRLGNRHASGALPLALFLLLDLLSLPAGLQGAHGVGLRPYWEPARRDADARESHSQHGDLFASGVQACPS